MNKAEIIKQQIVLIDKEYCFTQPNQIINIDINKQNCFTGVFSIPFLKIIMKENNELSTPFINPINNNEIIIGSFIFNYGNIPPKLIISKNINNELNPDKKINIIVKDIIEKSEIQNKIGAIGINYELYINNEDNNKNLNKIITNDNIINLNFSGIKFSAELLINNKTKLILTLQDAIVRDKKAVYINANFHNDIEIESDIQSIFEQDFYSILDNKISQIFNYDKK